MTSVKDVTANAKALIRLAMQSTELIVVRSADAREIKQYRAAFRKLIATRERGFSFREGEAVTYGEENQYGEVLWQVITQLV